MSTTLYRKYRPQKWADLTGQEHVRLTLEREITSGQLAHAYLFSGPRGTGKTTVARLLAKSLNCLKRNGSEPCNDCENCQEISAGRSLDVPEIDAASHTGVDNVRANIIDSARLAPSPGQYKIFIIDEAHMLSIASFNALLKTLEEPPPKVIFILATTELSKIPETIVSRCQNFEFRKAGAEEIKKRLRLLAKNEGFQVADQVLNRLAAASQGCLRDAESLLGQLLSLGQKNIKSEEADLILPRFDFAEAAKLIRLIGQKNLTGALTHLNSLVDRGLDLNNFSNNLVEFLRWLLHYKINGQVANEELDETALQEIQSLSQTLSLQEIIQMLEIFIKQKTNWRAASLPQLPLELALVSLCLDSLDSAPLIVKETSKPTAAAPTSPAANKPIEPEPDITLDLVKQKWQDYLTKVREYNHSLPFILKMSQPLELSGRSLKISLKYSFHCQKLNEPKTKQLAEKALNDIFGAALYLETVLIEETVPVAVEGDLSANTLVANLAQAFGGQVVE